MKILNNSALVTVKWRGKLYYKGLKINLKEFDKIFPKKNPFKQMDNLDGDNFLRKRLQVLARSAERTIFHIEKVGMYNEKFDFDKYKIYRLKLKKNGK